nr:uncharacterized protein LOC110142127 [Odocoileus virginianus texanus]
MTNTQWIFLKLLRLWKAGCVGGTLQGIGNIGESKSRVHNLIIYQELWHPSAAAKRNPGKPKSPSMSDLPVATHNTPQTPRKRVRITGKETANQLQGCIAVGTPSFSWLPELLLLSPGFGFSMAHGNPASSVYAAQKKDLLAELWPGSPRSQARGLRGQGDAGEDLGWDG